MDEELFKKAEKAAARLLKFRQTKRGFKDKMRRKGYPADVVEALTEKAENLGYINDSDYAAAFAHDSVFINRYGKIKIVRSLFGKGIDKETAAEALSVFDDEIYLDNLRYFVYKYFGDEAHVSKEDAEYFKKKMLARGYTYRQIQAVTEALVSE